MCTVLVRLDPEGRWPVVLGAVRDEFVDRSWDPPAAHWPGPWNGLVGGRDHTAGGTWMAVDPRRPAVAALLNGPPLPPPDDGEPRPTRGTLALQALAGEDLPADLGRYARFHLLLATVDDAHVWTWDAEALTHQRLSAGSHIVVNAGIDAADDPLVPHFAPLVAALPEDFDAWKELLRGDGLDPGDERALIVRKEVEGRCYGSTSASLVGLAPGTAHYEFTGTPTDPASWWMVGPAGIEPATEGL